MYLISSIATYFTKTYKFGCAIVAYAHILAPTHVRALYTRVCTTSLVPCMIRVYTHTQYLYLSSHMRAQYIQFTYTTRQQIKFSSEQFTSTMQAHTV